MCGIVGWVDWNQDLSGSRSLLDEMTDTLSYRGPDARGIWLSERAAIGHRRLTVVDPAGGAQPMVRQRGERDYVITYNGELYNTPDLRRELEAKGYSFQGHSDTEVLLSAYMEWGPDCVSRLNGIYAFGIWDEKAQQLFLARDRLGVKPLFYARREGALYFASELKALLPHPAIKPEINLEGLAEIFVVGPARTPGHGILKNVFELRPGRSLLWNRQGLQEKTYWNLVSHPHEDDFSTTVEKVRELFVDTVDRQLVADVPVSTFLSGGLDSSAITALAAGHFQKNQMGPLHTWSIDYVDNDRHFRPSAFQPNSDNYYIEMMTKTYGTQHHFIQVDTPELVDALIEATLANDRPGMADVDSSLLLFCREIKKGATVALSGESADEVFGGYPWFYREELLQRQGFPWAKATGERTRILQKDLAQAIGAEAYMAKRYEEALGEVPRLTGEEPGDARKRELFYLNITRFMPTLLDRKDRMSMRAGLEVRVPFCDHRLVEYVWNIPWSMKYHKEREKGILRQALEGLLPEEIIWRKKSPYPKTHNPAYLSAVQNKAFELLEDSGSPLRPLLDMEVIHAIAAEQGAANGTPWFGQLMGTAQLFAYLIQTDTWMRTCHIKIS